MDNPGAGDFTGRHRRHGPGQSKVERRTLCLLQRPFSAGIDDVIAYLAAYGRTDETNVALAAALPLIGQVTHDAF